MQAYTPPAPTEEAEEDGTEDPASEAFGGPVRLSVDKATGAVKLHAVKQGYSEEGAPVGAESIEEVPVANAAKLGGKEESALSVENSAKLGGQNADCICFRHDWNYQLQNKGEKKMQKLICGNGNTYEDARRDRLLPFGKRRMCGITLKSTCRKRQ